MRIAARSLSLFLVLAALAGCAREPTAAAPPSAAAPAAKNWPAFASAFIEARMKADPYFAVQSGRHEFDGQMPDWNRAALEADLAHTRTQLAELATFDPAQLT